VGGDFEATFLKGAIEQKRLKTTDFQYEAYTERWVKICLE